MNIENISDRAAAYGMLGTSIDGNDVLAVYRAAAAAVDSARAGKGPTLIECKTYRHKGHSRVDPARYRSKEEVQQWLAKDPIRRLEKRLLQDRVMSEDELKEIQKEVGAEIEKAVEFATRGPYPEPDEALEDVYA
jgi:pyruvate dehydrogenase E1 component alpha subunit